jgi:glycosyltransferase involved in cell wall biosynthesis
VPPGDAEALAGAWARLLALPTSDLAALGAAARRRVRERFSLYRAVAGYRALYLGEHVES